MLFPHTAHLSTNLIYFKIKECSIKLYCWWHADGGYAASSISSVICYFPEANLLILVGVDRVHILVNVVDCAAMMLEVLLWTLIDNHKILNNNKQWTQRRVFELKHGRLGCLDYSAGSIHQWTRGRGIIRPELEISGFINKRSFLLLFLSSHSSALPNNPPHCETHQQQDSTVAEPLHQKKTSNDPEICCQLSQVTGEKTTVPTENVASVRLISELTPLQNISHGCILFLNLRVERIVTQNLRRILLPFGIILQYKNSRGPTREPN